MSEDEIILSLRSKAREASPFETLQHLMMLKGGRLTQFETIRYFSAALGMPIRVMHQASTVRFVCGDRGVDDAEFDAVLAPLWPARSGEA